MQSRPGPHHSSKANQERPNGSTTTHGAINSLGRMEETARKQYRPWKAHWEVTYRCNLHCRHCFIDPADTTPEGDPNDIVQGLRKAGVLFVVVSGGEALMSPHFRDVVAALRRFRLSWRLLTNGTLLGEPEVHFIKETGASAVDVSIYAPPEAMTADGTAIHDKITGVPGSLDKSLTAVNLLTQAGVKVFVKSVLFGLNYSFAAGLRKLTEELGSGFVLDTTFVEPHRGFSREFRPLSLSETTMLYRDVLGLSPPEDMGEGNLCGTPGFCAAGQNILRVRPDGSVTPCVAIDETVGNILDPEFARQWRTHPFLEELRRVSLEDLDECSACIDNSHCVRCPGLALDETQSLYGPSTTACRQAAFRRHCQRQKSTPAPETMRRSEAK